MRSGQQKYWIVDLSILALVCLALLAPALILDKPVFVNDAVHNDMPELMRLTRGLQTGGTPLWNPYLFAGARPTIYQPNLFYYVPWWPFLMISDISDPASFAKTAMLLPYLLHMILAAAGTYIFLRHALGANRTGALAAGIIYAFGPAFSTAIEGVNQVALIAWLPWVAIAGTAFLRRGGAFRWAALLLVLVAANSSGVMHLLVRLYAFTSLLLFLVWLGLGGEIASSRTRAGRLAALAGAYVLAAGVLSPMWLGMYEARSMVQSVVSEMKTSSSVMLQSFEAEGHTPLLHFASMFCPDLFGVVTLHGWGVAVEDSVTQLGLVGGGIAMMSVVIYGLIRLLRNSSNAGPVTKSWWRASAAVCVLLIILMMGKHTFLYPLMARLGGFLVSGPHPYYYQFGVCWLLAVLAGLGVNELRSLQQPRQRIIFTGLAAACGMVAVTAAVIALMSPVNTEVLGPKTAALAQELSAEHPHLLWYHLLNADGGIHWLLTGPGVYILLSVLGCAAAIWFCPARYLASLALAALAIEYAVFAGTVLYSTTNIWQRELDFSPKGNRIPKLSHVGELNYFEQASAISNLAKENKCRWTMAWSRGDNLAQCFGTRALLGHASRPLIKGFYEAAKKVYSGFPYQLYARKGDYDALRRFLENENVGFLLSGSAQKIIRFTPVPAMYLQNTVERVDEAGQLTAVTSRSFADACLILPETSLKLIKPNRKNVSSKTPPGSVTWSRPHPDRMEVKSHGSADAMLVITECWHPGWKAKVDGEPTPVYKVNHHQIGIELPAGDHKVTLRFKPNCFTVGLWISLASLIAAGATFFAWRAAGRRGGSS